MRLRILYVCHRFPFPPKRGGKIRPFNMIRHLHQDHEVTVASLVRSPEEAREGEGLAAHCHQYLMERVTAPAAFLRMCSRLPTAQPFSMGYFYSPTLARRIQEQLASKPFDLIFVHCSSVAQYVSQVRDVPKILDFGDMDSQKWLEYAKYRAFPISEVFRLEGTKLMRAEKRLAAQFNLCTCTTKAEMETLNDYGVPVRTDWFPNGVDFDYFHPTDEPYDPHKICFVGRMDYYPNQQCVVEFCRHVLPKIQKRHPQAWLEVIGANPPQHIRRLSQLPGVQVTGTVRDVRSYVRSSAINVAPLQIARGTQNKILESLAMGVPVVASRKAVAGVDVVDQEHIISADTHDSMAEAVLRFLEDPQHRRRYAEAGRERVTEYHDWAHSMQRLDRLVMSCISPSASSPVTT